jgi:hypothetical protein
MLAVTDPRREAWVARCLEAAGFDVIRASAASDATLCVMDATSANLPAADRFLREAPDRRVIGIGAAAPGWAARGVSVVEDPNNLQAVRAAIDSVTWAGSGGGA